MTVETETTSSPQTAGPALTPAQCAEIERLAAYPAKTILVDEQYGQAWQTGRARRYKGMSMTPTEVAVLTVVGSKEVYQLILDAGADNNAELIELLECGPFTEVPLPHPAPAPADDMAVARRVAGARRYVSRTWAKRIAILHFVTPEVACYQLFEDGRLADCRSLTPSQFDATFKTAGTPAADVQAASLLVTKDQEPESKYYIDTALGEYWSASRRAAVRFAKTLEAAEVWEIDGERIYCAEAC